MTNLPISSLQSLYAQLGRAHELNDDRERARAMYAEMLNVARERHAASMECAALSRQALLVAQDARDFQRASELLRTALAVAEASGDTIGVAETEWALAQTAHYASDMEGCLTHGQRALSLARDVGAKELIARSVNVLAYAYDEMGRWVETLNS